jgi:hypothetical protein
LRRRAVQLTGLLLVLQSVWLVTPVWALACGSENASTPADEDACCAGLKPGQMCPLHRHRQGHDHTPPPPASDAPYKLRASCDPPSALLQSLTLGIGDLIAPTHSSSPDRPMARQPYVVVALSMFVPPDLPPPRFA